MLYKNEIRICASLHEKLEIYFAKAVHLESFGYQIEWPLTYDFDDKDAWKKKILLTNSQI